MKKTLAETVSKYSRYLESLKAEGADIKKNYVAMRNYINENTEGAFKLHFLQDCYLQCLLAHRGRQKDINPSLVISRLISSNCSEKAVRYAESQFNRSYSCLPTLYLYFRPKTEDDVKTMGKELEQMYDIGIITKEDVDQVKLLCLFPCLFKAQQTEQKRKQVESERIEYKYTDEDEKVFDELKEKYFKKLEESLTLYNKEEVHTKLMASLKREALTNKGLYRRLENVIRLKLERRLDELRTSISH